MAQVGEYVTIPPVHGGHCAWCGATIKLWYNAMWCDDCLDEWLALPVGFCKDPKTHFETRRVTGWTRNGRM